MVLDARLRMETVAALFGRTPVGAAVHTTVATRKRPIDVVPGTLMTRPTPSPGLTPWAPAAHPQVPAP